MDDKHLAKVVRHIWNCEYGLPSWGECVILAFCKMYKSETEESTLYYKVFLDRLYIIRRDFKQTNKVTLANNGGFTNPWNN